MSKPFISKGFFSGGSGLTGGITDLEGLLNLLSIRSDLGEPTVRVAVFSNTTRPDPATVPAGTVIFNSDDGAPNWSDGTVWRNSAGVIT